jgi:hypothetical protein
MVKLTEEENKIRNLGLSIKEMMATRGWQEGGKTYLESLAHHTWVDPREAKNKDEYMYRELVCWALSKAAEDMLRHFENAVSAAQAIEDKASGKTADRFEDALS